jgi:hypothetical protein
MRMLRKAGNNIAMVHAPAVLTLEVIADVSARKRTCGPEPIVAGGIFIQMMDAEEKRI